MPSTTVLISNKFGLHARPAARLAETANRYQSTIQIHSKDKTVDAKSIMQVMMLAAGHGQSIRIEAEGEDAQNALQALQTLFETGFGEQ